jgi:hypothetical protein
MATQLNPVVEGETEPIVHQLLSDGTPFLIQGLTVELILEKKDGTIITTAGKLANLDDGTEGNRGKMQYSPSAGDFVKAGSDYYVRWKVTDGAGKVAFWPGGEAAKMKVYAVAKP